MENQVKKVSLSGKISKNKVLRISLLVGVVALVLAANILFSVLCNSMYWYADLTKNQITRIDQAVEFLADARGAYLEKNGQEVAFRAIFCVPRDRALEASGGMYVVRCVEEFENKIPDFTTEYYDVKTNPSLVEEYRATAVSAISSNNIILEAVKKDTGDRIGFRVFTLTSFYSYDSQGALYAFNGEYRVVSTLLGLIGERPTATVVTGHGETTESAPGADGLIALCEECGFAPVVVDLRTQDMPADTQVVIINNPTADYGTTELRKVEKYVNNGGNIMLFMDPVKYDLYNLEQLAAQYGVEFLTDAYVQDASIAQNADNFALSAVYDASTRKDESTDSYVDMPGAQLTAELRAMESRPKAMFENAVAMRFLNKGDTNFQSGANYRDVSSVFNTTDAAVILREGASGTEVAAMGEAFPLMSWGVETFVHNDNFIGTTTYGYQLVSGCTAYTSYAYLQSNAYGNNDVIKHAFNSMRVRAEEAEIEFRVLDKQKLEITEDNTAWQTVFTVIAVLAVAGTAVCGVVVHARRKYQ